MRKASRRGFRWAAGALLLLAAGCANPYGQSYRPANLNISFIPATTEPQLLGGTGEARRDVYGMFENGQGFLGMSAFVGEAQDPKNALTQAKSLFE